MSGATATYRGFRRQALYVLAHLLGAGNAPGLVFQPEGVEDLAVFDGNHLIEAIQVKDYRHPLKLSDLGPRKPDGFFSRLAKQQRTNPNLHVRLVHFGDLGEELRASFQGDESARREIVRKVSRFGHVSASEITNLLNVTKAYRAHEAELVGHITSRFRESAAGVDPVVALDLTSWWLYLASEEQRPLQHDDLLRRLLDIGKFLHERAAHHREWYTTIEPLLDQTSDGRMTEALAGGFSRGVAVEYAHILANLDIRRSDRLRAIADGFAVHRVVILRGASGQGKSALAYRYLHDFVPNGWRFRVRLVEDRIRALSIATALLGHANALEVPIVVLVDVAPHDEGWPVLVQELARHPRVKVLVAIREEDWHRAELYGHELDYADVLLDFNRPEAERLWAAIPLSVDRLGFVASRMPGPGLARATFFLNSST